MTDLEKLPPEAFLDPENFKTPLDTNQYGSEQCDKGLLIGSKSKAIHIGINNVWSAEYKNSYFQSYEKIGFHSNTSDLLRGFLESNTKIIVHRDGTETIIKG